MAAATIFRSTVRLPGYTGGHANGRTKSHLARNNQNANPPVIPKIRPSTNNPIKPARTDEQRKPEMSITRKSRLRVWRFGLLPVLADLTLYLLFFYHRLFGADRRAAGVMFFVSRILDAIIEW